MRAVKSILVSAGALKRTEPHLSEEIILIRAMRDSNVPKFLHDDVVLFMAIVQDLFPNVSIPDVDHGILQSRIIECLEARNFQPVPSFVRKIIQLHETMLVRHGVMLVGDSATGKSANYETLLSALTSLAEDHFTEHKVYRKTSSHVLNPKSITMEELYGSTHELTQEWKDGLVAKIARTVARDTTDTRHWIVFDGPVDALWIEDMNTVLDDNRMLCLSNGERIRLPHTVSLLFEVQDLATASPATVSRCGMVYMEPSNLDGVWRPLYKSWIKTVEERLPGKSEKLLQLIEKTVGPLLEFVRNECAEFIRSSDANLVQSLLSLLDALLTPENAINLETDIYHLPLNEDTQEQPDTDEEQEEDKVDHPEENGQEGNAHSEHERQNTDNGGAKVRSVRVDVDKLIDMYFVFAVVWSLGSNLDDSSREKFDTFVRSQILPSLTSVAFPHDGQVYDYYVSIEHHEFRPWQERVRTFQYDPSVPFFNIIVPNVDTSRFHYLTKTLISAGRNVLVTGVTGVGKSVLIEDMLRSELRADDPLSAFMSITMNLSAQTKSQNVQELLEEKLESKRRNLLGAPSGKQHAVFFIDDLDMPKLEEYGAQPPIELVRQMIDQGGFYDRDKLFFKHIRDTTIITSCAQPGGGRNAVTPRLLRHFHMLNFPSLSTDSMRKIFGSIVEGFLGSLSRTQPDSVHESHFPPQEFVDLQPHAYSIVDASIEMFQRIKTELLPRPASSHYTFNLRDLSKLFQGILQISSESVPNRETLVRLWLHEGSRVFCDRLISDTDRHQFATIQEQMLQKHFDLQWEATSFENILFGDYMERGGGIYQEITDMEKLTSLLQEYVVDYNVEKNTELNLVFFKDAVQHLSRICRIIRQPRGSAVLVGVGGSGRRSLTRLAAFMEGCQCFEIEVTRNFKHQHFRESVKDMMLTAGCENKPVVFLFSDTQIVDESILEDIHNILNTGEIPNLFKDDMEQIIQATRPRVKALGKIETRDVIFQHFIHLVRENFHIVLCMSPIGESFRERIRMFPSLVNNCTIDWYNGWPEDALYSVARHLLDDSVEQLQEYASLRDAICRMCVRIHTSVAVQSDMFLAELRRHNYTTPTSYLDLISLYKSMMKEQKDVLEKSLKKFSSGLQRLDDTNAAVAALKEELVVKQPILDQAVKNTEELSEKLAKQRDEAKRMEEERKIEEQEAQAQLKVAEDILNECKAELNKSEPLIKNALKSLETVTAKEITEIRSFSNPPERVKLVLEAMCILFNRSPTWDESKALLANFKLDHLKNYDKSKLDSKMLRRLEKYVKDERFVPDLVYKHNRASKPLCEWVIAIYEYAKALQIITPKRKNYEIAQAKADEVNARLQERQKALAESQAMVAEMHRELDRAKLKIEELEHEIEQTKIKIQRAEKLVTGLADERTRWENEVSQLKADKINLAGNILLATGSVSYLGPFTSPYRQRLIGQWVDTARDLGIPVDEKFSLTRIVDPVKVNEWISNGLPADDFSIDNAILVENARRWPLLIDPQEQGSNWIKRSGTTNNLRVVKASDTDVMKKLEAAIRVGLPVLLENVAEQLDPALEPVLQRRTFRQAGRLLIRLGDSDVDYNPKFRLYITTKLANPHFMPEVCTRVLLINMSVTPQGLEEQLLADVVTHERPDLEEQKNSLVLQISAAKSQLSDIEDKILTLLQEAKPETILDDEVLITALQESKSLSEKIQRSLDQAERTAEEINAARENYRPAATRASILYFVISEMTNVDPMYQNSLAFFKSLFQQCLSRSERSDDVERRLVAMMEHTTETTYNVICRGLFEKDKLLFSFLITVQVLRRSGVISDAEWTFFLRGSSGAGGEAQPCPFDWMPNSVWNELCALERLPGYENLQKSIQDEQAEWKHYYETDTIHLDAPPEPFNSSLSQWRKLLLLKVLRQEKVLFGIGRLISSYLGPKFTKVPRADLQNVYDDSSCKTPIIFVLSSGADPQSMFDKFAAEMGQSDKVLSLSLGQGQGTKAAQLIAQGQATGEWVFLQNCHLSVSWLPELDHIVEQLTNQPNVHPEFRLWLTSMPSNQFPVPILQSSLKITNEPPRGLRANITGNLDSIDDELYEKSAPQQKHGWKKLLFGLVYFHALIQERRRYGSLGWNLAYEWNVSDLDASVQSLKLYLEETQGQIPWQALLYTVGVIHYGGRVTDFLDLRAVQSILSQFFCEDILEDGFKFTSDGTYSAPTAADLETLSSVRAFVARYPSQETPVVFGLHENASISLQRKETRQLLDTIIAIQPRTTGASSDPDGRTNDDVVLEIVSDFLDQLPARLDTSGAHPDTFAATADGTANSLGTFLLQEVEQFNRLLNIIGSSLDELRKAVSGQVVMSSEIELMYSSILYQRVPAIWTQNAYPSLRPLRAWFENLRERVAFMERWITHGPPTCFNISHFFFPQGFLTAVLQTHARRFKIPIDTLRFRTHVLTEQEEQTMEIRGSPDVGVYVNGWFMEGARWDRHRGCIAESLPGELYTEMPPLWLEPKTIQDYDEDKVPGLYKCPAYKTAERAGALSTTGLSTNYVLSCALPSGDHPPRVWIARGTAMLLEIV